VSRGFLSDVRGNTAVFFGLSLPILVGFIGLGTETGYWYWKHRQLQEAVDIASHTGAIKLRDTNDDEIAEAAAADDAELHGYNPAMATIAVNTPPTTGTHQDNKSVEVEITHTQPRFFSAVLSSSPVTIRVRAVSSYIEHATACVLALSKTAVGAVNVWGSADVTFSGCTVMSNSVDEQSVLLGGTSHLTAPCVSAVGGVDSSGTLNLTVCNEIKEYAPYVEDPFGGVIAPPTTTACQTVPSGDPVTVSAGRYCGGFNLTGNVTLNPGVYVIDGGTFKVNAGTIVNGSDVMFYLTGDAEISFNGGAELNLSAATAGAYKGILFFGDRNSDNTLHKFNGTADSSLIGALYFASQDVEILGDFAGSNGCTQIVASTVKFSGNTDFSADCTGTGIEDIALSGTVQIVE
jgi:Flp pilus assembly protein TadG